MVAPRARRSLKPSAAKPPARVGRIIAALEEAFGRPGPGGVKDPLSELIFTILSQNTSDTNRDRAWASLHDAFESWEAVARAPRRRVESAIRVGGLAATKSRVIQEVLGRVRQQEGGYTLDRLKKAGMEEVEAYLRDFKGVGLKTIRCVQVFSLGQPAFPVDTHIFRITRRIGLVPGKATPETAHRIMGELTPPGEVLPFHVNLITLGRRICKPAAPRCGDCPIRRWCDHGRGRVA